MSERLAELHKRIRLYEEQVEELMKELAIKDSIIKTQICKNSELKAEIILLKERVKQHVEQFKEII